MNSSVTPGLSTAARLTVTIADDELRTRLSDMTDRVDFVEWDLQSPLDPAVAERVELVVVPHYFTRAAGFDAMAALPRLRWVQLPSAGYEYAVSLIPTGVGLCNGRGVHDAATAELAIGLTIAAQRGIDEAARATTWTPRPHRSLADRRVMVIGHGSVGQAIINRLQPFEVEVVRVASHARTTPDGHTVHGINELPALLPGVDIVIVVVPQTPSTVGLVDATFLASLKDGALLVNVARGPVVDTDALLAELTTGRIHAALDVTDPEPLPDGHPLWTAPGVLITPHQGGMTDAVHPRFAALVRRQLEALLAGEEPTNVVVEPGATSRG